MFQFVCSVVCHVQQIKIDNIKDVDGFDACSVEVTLLKYSPSVSS